MKPNKFIFCLCCVVLFVCNSLRAQSLTIYTSPYSVDTTLQKIKASIDSNDFKFVAERKFEAKGKAEQKFSGTVTIVEFETPEVYELAACEPTTMLDMPLKVVVWLEDGDVFVGYMRTKELKKRFLATQCEDLLYVLNRAMIRVVNDAVREH